MSSHHEVEQPEDEDRPLSRKPYQRPRIVSREPIEAVAAVCVPGKANPGECPAGPLAS